MQKLFGIKIEHRQIHDELFILEISKNQKQKKPPQSNTSTNQNIHILKKKNQNIYIDLTKEMHLIVLLTPSNNFTLKNPAIKISK